MTPVTIANPGSATYSRYDRAFHVLRFDGSVFELETRRFDDGRGRGRRQERIEAQHVHFKRLGPLGDLLVRIPVACHEGA